MKICVVNAARIFAESKPAAAAREHLSAVQETLKKGLDSVVELYKDSVASPQAQNAIAQARNLLQQQMNVEQQAADMVVRKIIADAVEAWKDANSDVDLIIDRAQIMFCAPALDITDTVMERVNAQTPSFPDLPKVNITRPASK
ncbi:MAG: OmpH family outer membrane protein [Pyramidobacter sp.]|nr:OmpH family outer membrane protein [Pyramidobacter sp.]